MASMSQNISAKQLQSLVMTPQLQQSLKMLELSTQELQEYVEQELERNPLLEKQEERSDEGDANNEQSSHPDTSDNKDVFEQSNDRSGEDASGALDADFSNVWQDKRDDENGRRDESSYESLNYDGDSFDKMAYLEQTVAGEMSLEEKLQDQITLEFTQSTNRMIALKLLDSLDDRGYFDGDLSLIATELGCEIALVEKILSRCQEFYPTGIFSRTLAECLENQLRERNRFDPMMKKLLANLDLIAQAELKKLQKICAVDEQELREMIEEIRLLHPYPASDYFVETSQNIVADIFLTKDDGGGWKLELNQDTMPRLLVNNDYYASIKKSTQDKNEIHYVTEQFNTANWLLRTLHQRQETILKVASQIVKIQDEFLEKGVMYLKPMILSDIAEKVEMHESTVGRVTTNKYIATPRGIFELKYFFSSGVQNKGSDQMMSNKSVKHKIQALIEKETIENILSDDKIAEVLKAEGIDVARRTVSKYREALGIASSSQRKKKKKLEFSL